MGEFIDGNLKNVKIVQNGIKSKKCDHVEEIENFVPPDGGSRAWVVMLCSFFCNGLLFGIINSSGIFHQEFSRYLETLNDTEASRKAALVESLTMGTVFMMSPVSGILTDCIGIRMTTFLGGAIASGGLFISSFCDYNIEALTFFFGVMFGFGGALAYTPSLAILGHYFKNRLGIVNGFVSAGSSTFTVIMSYLIYWLLKNVKIAWTFRILAILVAAIMGCSLVFRPLHKKPKQLDKSARCKSAFNVSIWKNKRYVIWAILVPCSLFGYFVPYVHMPKFVEVVISKDSDGKLPVTCIGITSLLGKLIFGYLADLPRVNRIFLQQLAFFGMGLMVMLMPACKGSFPWLIVVSLSMGLFDGCVISLLGPVAFELCGHYGATQAIGFILGLCSVPLTVGPYLAGILYDQTSSYTKAFVYAGIPPVAGAVALFLIRCLKLSKEIKEDAEEPLEYQKVYQSDVKESLSCKGEHERLTINADPSDDRPEDDPNKSS